MNNNEMIIDYSSYKWLISSCLQKSLRRGRFDLAQHYIHFLWEHDRNYLTYRFSTILSEDVGIANIDLINEYLSTNIAKRKIDEAGGIDFFLSITKRSCESVKDRSSCDSAYIAGYYELSIDNSRDNNHKIEQLSNIFLNKESSYIDRINAGWTILGNTKFNHSCLPWLDNYPTNEKGKNVDDLSSYLALCKSLPLDQNTINSIEDSYKTQRENICLGLPIIKNLYDTQLQSQVEKLNHDSSYQPKFLVGNFIENTYIKETTFMHPVLNIQIISAGIDGHTREGKTAYYKYLKSNTEFTKYLYSKKIPQEEHMHILSHCMFRTEGHEVNKRLFFPSAVEVMRDCEQKILDMKVNRGEKYLDFGVIKNILIKDVENINSFRSEGIKNATAPMIEKPVPKTKKVKV